MPRLITCLVQSEICKSCYAKSGPISYKNSKNLYMNNYETIQKRGLDFFEQWLEMAIVNAETKYFRFHSVGDIFAYDYLQSILNVCQSLHYVNFWLPTHNYKLLRQAIRQNVKFPSNLSINISSIRGTNQAEKASKIISFAKKNGVNFYHAYMVPRKSKPQKNIFLCPASTGERKSCTLCRHCWTGGNVQFAQH